MVNQKPSVTKLGKEPVRSNNFDSNCSTSYQSNLIKDSKMGTDIGRNADRETILDSKSVNIVILDKNGETLHKVVPFINYKHNSRAPQSDNLSTAYPTMEQGSTIGTSSPSNHKTEFVTESAIGSTGKKMTKF